MIIMWQILGVQTKISSEILILSTFGLDISHVTWEIFQKCHHLLFLLVRLKLAVIPMHLNDKSDLTMKSDTSVSDNDQWH